MHMHMHTHARARAYIRVHTRTHVAALAKRDYEKFIRILVYFALMQVPTAIVNNMLKYNISELSLKFRRRYVGAHARTRARTHAHTRAHTHSRMRMTLLLMMMMILLIRCYVGVGGGACLSVWVSAAALVCRLCVSSASYGYVV